MNALQLLKRVEQIIKDHGNIEVGVAWQEFRENCELFDAEIGKVVRAQLQFVHLADADGGIAVTKKGTERGSFMIVLHAHEA